MIVYLITNRINGKQYVGQTTQALANRWKTHCSPASGCFAISSAIHKYGKDNFSIEIIFNADSLEELDKKEEEFINKFNTLSPNGYNLKTGGNVPRMSEESKRKMSLASKARIPWNKGLTKDDPRVAAYIKSGENHPLWGKIGARKGKHHSEEARLKMSKSHVGLPSGRKGKKNSEAHIKALTKFAVICNETGKKYESARLASQELRISIEEVYRSLYYNFKKKKSGRYTFDKVEL